jgi:nitrite reductase/ring-hydroxylating ferredoxin subunit
MPPGRRSRIEREDNVAEYVDVVAASEVPEGEMVGHRVNGHRIAVANVEGSFLAFDETCTHRGCSLARGELEEKTVICPCHFGQFDLLTGQVLAGPPPEPIRVYPTRVRNGTVQVEI